MNPVLISRILPVPSRTFFLFGPRGVGKSTWLRQTLSGAVYIDLLDSALFLELAQAPRSLEAIVGNHPPDSWIVIDEIQKIPLLLDEVHRLIENRRWRFALCGSSARKLRRRGVNLLGGRAITRNMAPFSRHELGPAFDPDFSVEWGMLPLVQQNRTHAADLVQSYVHTYLAQEIREEGVVRSAPPFMRFLNIAGQLNGQVVNGLNISREAAVPRSTVDVYFSILEDTLIGHILPAYRPQAKIREQAHPKFYWFDAGVARAAAGLAFDPVDRTWLGTALETLVYHELRVYNEARNRNRDIAYYRTASGVEIDFIIETNKRTASRPPEVVCLEVKLSTRWQTEWERPMRDLAAREKIQVNRMIGVYTGERSYHRDGVDIWPLETFLEALHVGEVF